MYVYIHYMYVYNYIYIHTYIYAHTHNDTSSAIRYPICFATCINCYFTRLIQFD